MENIRSHNSEFFFISLVGQIGHIAGHGPYVLAYTTSIPLHRHFHPDNGTQLNAVGYGIKNQQRKLAK